MAALGFFLGCLVCAQPLPKFMGRQVTIAAPELDDDGSFPKGPATVCLEGPPERQCYTAPKDFGRDPQVSVVQLQKDLPALLFSADGGGAFWHELSLSKALIFLTADFVWAADEFPYDPRYVGHRYVISAYILEPSSGIESTGYYLEDRYMTVRKYDFMKADILASERQEILTRLRRVKAAYSTAMAAPALPFFDWGACPYETCGYHQWTAHRSVTVYDTWKQGRRPVAQLAKGDTVTGLTGVVITFKPGVIRLDRDLPGENLLRGDTILTYADRGEGFSAVWFKGRYRADFDITFAKRPDGTGCGGAHCAATYLDLGRKVWWAKVKLKSGRTGWVEMDLAGIPVSLY